MELAPAVAPREPRPTKFRHQNTQPATNEQAKAQAQGASENVSLSNQAKNLKQLEQKLGDYPEMDDDRIEQIRSALENGTYKIDAEKLAQKCLRWMKAFSGDRPWPQLMI